MEPRKRRFLVVDSVQAELTRQRMSPEQLADAARIPLSVLARRLAGEGSFSVDELDAVAGALGVTVDSLLTTDGRK